MGRVRWAIGAVLSAATGCEPPPEYPDGYPRLVAAGTTAEPLPVVNLRYRPDKMWFVTLVLENRSAGPLRYPTRSGNAVALLEGTLYEDGERLKGRLSPDWPLLSSRDVRGLPPGGEQVIRHPLIYADIPPGRYELRVSYRVTVGSTPHTDLGLTPADLEARCVVNVFR